MLSQVVVDDSISVVIPNIILGKQAEFLFSEAIKACSKYSVLKENIQINQEKLTLGELDYILKSNTNHLYHVELACKFYLLKEDESSQLEGQWIGPNLKDTLADKINKFKSRQFPLLRHPATKEVLTSLDTLPDGKLVSKTIQQRYCIKAALFVPEGYAKKLPAYYQNCLQGVYKKHKTVVLNKEATYAIPSKREWLLPESHITAWFSAHHISEVISEQIANKRSPLVYEKLGDQITCFFVVWW